MLGINIEKIFVNQNKGYKRNRNFFPHFKSTVVSDYVFVSYRVQTEKSPKTQ